MHERISRADVFEGLNAGEIIKNYPDDAPYPSALVLGSAGGRPVHVVAALDANAPGAHIIAVYEPSPDEFESDWRTRKTR